MIKDYQMFTTQDCIIGNKKNNNDELGSIFGENIVYEVPSYQREYHWKKTQLDEFWSDLKKAFNEKKMYYLGTIVGINKNDGKTIELVDGQQRLTTIMIMFFVLEEFSSLKPFLLQTYFSCSERFWTHTFKVSKPLPFAIEISFSRILISSGWSISSGEIYKNISHRLLEIL